MPGERAARTEAAEKVLIFCVISGGRVSSDCTREGDQASAPDLRVGWWEFHMAMR